MPHPAALDLDEELAIKFTTNPPYPEQLNIGDEETESRVLTLNQNYPNPFSKQTTIRFNLPHAGETSLRVYNTSGQVIRTVRDGVLSSGLHTYTWDGLNDAGENVTSGVYFFRLKTGDKTETKKMVLIQ